MGVVNLELHGLLGILVFLATVVVLIVATLMALVFFRVDSKRDDENRKLRWSKFFGQAGMILLAFDLVFYVLVFLKGDNVITKEEGILFDQRMLYIWIPFHFFGYFMIAAALRLIGRRRREINEFIDKLR